MRDDPKYSKQYMGNRAVNHRRLRGGKMTEFFRALDQPTTDWMIQQVKDGGYESVTEYLADMVIDLFYEATHRKHKEALHAADQMQRLVDLALEYKVRCDELERKIAADGSQGCSTTTSLKQK